MSSQVVDSAAILGWTARSIDALTRRRDEINQLNVFPVADSDTGSNMLHTLTAAYEAARAVDAADNREVTAALAAGAFHGARGNSGTVLSQVFRAVAETASSDGIGVHSIQQAMQLAVGHVLRSIANPVEGTVLTVLRQAAQAATDYRGKSVAELADTIAAAARQALAKTPSQLPALRRAGVVDAGGAGLVILLDAFADETAGRGVAPTDVHLNSVDDTKAEMEVMYVISLPDEASAAILRSRLASLGSCLIVAAEASDDDNSQYLVHIHTKEPGAVIESALDVGRPQSIRIEVLDDQSNQAAARRVVLAIVPAGALTELITAAGAIPVIAKGAGEERGVVVRAMTAIRGAREAILLPNGLVSNEELAGFESSVSAVCPRVAVVPSESIAAGLAALSVHSPQLPLPAAAFAMRQAADGTRSASIAADVDKPLPAALAETVVDLAKDGGELVTLLLGDRARSVDVEGLRARLRRETDRNIEIVAYDASGIAELAQIGIE